MSSELEGLGAANFHPSQTGNVPGTEPGDQGSAWQARDTCDPTPLSCRKHPWVPSPWRQARPFPQAPALVGAQRRGI